jgi:preprotein translocase subunit YajC
MSSSSLSSFAVPDAFGFSPAAFPIETLVHTLAQTAPPLTGAPTAGAPAPAGTAIGGGTTTAPGAVPGGAPAAGQQGGGAMFLIMFGAIALLFIFTIMTNRRETKRKKEMLDSLKKNDRVQTIGGIIGSIVEIKPELVVLKVDENSNTKVTFARTAVVGVIKESATTEQPKS